MLLFTKPLKVAQTRSCSIINFFERRIEASIKSAKKWLSNFLSCFIASLSALLVFRDGLLAENCLASHETLKDQIFMSESWRGNECRINVGTLENRFRILHENGIELSVRKKKKKKWRWYSLILNLWLDELNLLQSPFGAECIPFSLISFHYVFQIKLWICHDIGQMDWSSSTQSKQG